MVCRKGSKNPSWIIIDKGHDIIQEKMSQKVAYSLGLLFADGYIYQKNNRISIEMKSEDLDSLIPILNELAEWNISYRQRKRNGNDCKPITVLYKGSKILSHFLSENGYSNPKNSLLASSYIPKDLFYMWLRGFYDGDGCLYINPKIYNYQVSLAGDKNMDWSFLPDDLSFVVNAKVTSGSSVRLTSKKKINNFMNFIYPYGYDGIGMERKYIKF